LSLRLLGSQSCASRDTQASACAMSLVPSALPVASARYFLTRALLRPLMVRFGKIFISSAVPAEPVSKASKTDSGASVQWISITDSHLVEVTKSIHSVEDEIKETSHGIRSATEIYLGAPSILWTSKRSFATSNISFAKWRWRWADSSSTRVEQLHSVCLYWSHSLSCLHQYLFLVLLSSLLIQDVHF
jgi:hypothetical protein